MKEDEIVAIKVTRMTREKLKARGNKGDTYEKVVTGMFKELEEDGAT